MSDEADIDAYFERIGFAGSIAPSLATLEQLHVLHPAAIPFENIDPLRGVPVRLDLANLQQKLLFERRGGYCIEQNLLFMAVLETLGFTVRGLGARVLWGNDEDVERPLSHMLIAVDIGGGSYIADVGFGGLTLTAPLRVRADVEQQTPHETFRLLEQDGSWRLEAQIEEEWRALYAFSLTEMERDDYEAMNDATSSSPRFRDNLLVARSEKGRRLALRNTVVRTHVTGGASERRLLGTVAELRDVLIGMFGLALPAPEKLDPVLEKVLALPAAD